MSVLNGVLVGEVLVVQAREVAHAKDRSRCTACE